MNFESADEVDYYEVLFNQANEIVRKARFSAYLESKGYFIKCLFTAVSAS